MSNHNDSTPAIEPLDQVVATYMEAIERGERPDREHLIAQNPSLAERLRQFFSDLDNMGHAAAQLKVPNVSGFASLETIRYLGDYELLEKIAQGGMGIVYKARQVSLNRLVAVKLILAGNLASPKERDRFRIEAEAAAQLDHPNIVPVFEVGEHDERQYLSMKLIDGASLDKIPAANAREEVKAMLPVIRAVQHAHDRLILHRDLKPSNIVVASSGERYVTDFGLAKLLASDAGLTNTGQLLGTPRYMSPEQAAGMRTLTVGTDVYSLGVILFERLCGRTPFTGENPVAVIQQVIRSPAPKLSTFNAKISVDLDTILDNCLRKEANLRYRSANDLAEDLENWLSGLPISARRLGPVEKIWRWCLRNRAVASLSATIFIALFFSTLVLSILTWRLDEQRDLAAASRENAVFAQRVAEDRLLEGLLRPFRRRQTEFNPSLFHSQTDSLWQLADLDDPQLQFRIFDYIKESVHETRIPAAIVALDETKRRKTIQILNQQLKDPALPVSRRIEMAGLLLPLMDASTPFVDSCRRLLADSSAADQARWISALGETVVVADPQNVARFLQDAWRFPGRTTIGSNMNDMRNLIVNRLPAEQAHEFARAYFRSGNYAYYNGLSLLHALSTSDACNLIESTLKEKLHSPCEILIGCVSKEQGETLRSSISAKYLDIVTKDPKQFFEIYDNPFSFRCLTSRDAASWMGPLLEVAKYAKGDSDYNHENAAGEFFVHLDKTQRLIFATLFIDSMLEQTDPYAKLGHARWLSSIAEIASEDESTEICNKLLDILHNDQQDHYTIDVLNDFLKNIGGNNEEADKFIEVLSKTRSDATNPGVRKSLGVALYTLIASFPSCSSDRADHRLSLLFELWGAEANRYVSFEYHTRDLIVLFKLSNKLPMDAAARWKKKGLDLFLSNPVKFNVSDSVNQAKEFTSAISLEERQEIVERLLQKAENTTGPEMLPPFSAAADLLWSLDGESATSYGRRMVRLLSTPVVLVLINDSTLPGRPEKLIRVLRKLASQTDREGLDHKRRRITSERLRRFAGRGGNRDDSLSAAENLVSNFEMGAPAEGHNISYFQLIAYLRQQAKVEDNMDYRHIAAAIVAVNADRGENSDPDIPWRVLQSLAAHGKWADFIVQGEDPYRDEPEQNEPEFWKMDREQLDKEWETQQDRLRNRKCVLTTPQIVELLKYPTLTGKAKRTLLDHLENRYQQRFDTQWDFVEYAEREKLGLDFKSPPRRPTPRDLLDLADRIEKE